MAFSQKFLARNHLGNRREVFIEATFDSETSALVETGLKLVLASTAQQIAPTGGTVDANITLWDNFLDAGSNDDDGAIFVANVASQAGAKYIIRAIGV